LHDSSSEYDEIPQAANRVVGGVGITRGVAMCVVGAELLEDGYFISQHREFHEFASGIGLRAFFRKTRESPRHALDDQNEHN
jgi:hypothetical protein